MNSLQPQNGQQEREPILEIWRKINKRIAEEQMTSPTTNRYIQEKSDDDENSSDAN